MEVIKSLQQTTILMDLWGRMMLPSLKEINGGEVVGLVGSSDSIVGGKTEKQWGR